MLTLWFICFLHDFFLIVSWLNSCESRANIITDHLMLKSGKKIYKTNYVFFTVLIKYMWVSNNSKILFKKVGEDEKKGRTTHLITQPSLMIDFLFWHKDNKTICCNLSEILWPSHWFPQKIPQRLYKTEKLTQNPWLLLYFLDKGDRLWMPISLLDICVFLINLYKTQ